MKVETSNPSNLTENQQPSTDNRQPTTTTPPKKKLSFKEQRELETIEKEMPKLENQRAKILDQLNNETDYEKIAKLSANLESVSNQLEEYEMSWLELNE